MKTIRDIEKLLGITRRSLQEYDKIGLLHPSARNQYGHILYDDEAIKKLMLIKIFVECGYKRKEIISFFEKSDEEKADEYKKLIRILRDKRKRIAPA